MKTNWKTAVRRATAVAAAIGLIALGNGANAEEPIASELNSSDIAPGYFGAWDLTFRVDAINRDISVVLNIVDVGGKVGATLDAATQPEPLAISSIELVDGRIDMNSELVFGGRITIDININVVLEGDQLVGSLKDSNELLKADFRIGKLTEEQLKAIEENRPDPTEARLNIDGKRVRVIAADLEMGNSDWDLFQEVEEGEVFAFTLSGATKMITDFDLYFGDTLVKTENIVDGYPGVYSLWLKRTGDGWNLVFNSQPDIWGTLRRPEFDVAEVPLATSKMPQESQKHIVGIDQTAEGGVLKLAWGDIEWKAPFKIVQ